MRVMIALEDRFLKGPGGNIYSNTICDYEHWKRYLQVFDEVTVLARLGTIDKDLPNKKSANGPGVTFFPLPYYVGLWQYMRQHYRIKSMMSKAVKQADVFILRIPGRIGTLLWHNLMMKGIPYGVEVVGSSRESARTSGANFLVRGICKLLKGQKEQCEHASAALYVTNSYLQKAYPVKCWSISCSNVNLPEEAIISEASLKQRAKSIGENRTFRVCHAGTMEVFYKAQDVLIKAASICLQKGLDLELTLIGDGRHRNYFEEKARSLGIAKRIFFLGQLPPGQQIRDQFDKADLFILPSLTEGQPRVLIEAMARGLPCLGTNVGGIADLLEPEYLIKPGDAEGIAKKISELMQDRNRLETMSRRNLEESKKYHTAILNQRRIDFYKKVAELAT